MFEKIQLEKTKRGYPAYWEKGGGCSNTGHAYVIADANGQAKKAIYIRRRGHLANERHALIPLSLGDYIIIADHHREDFTIIVYQVIDFKTFKTKDDDEENIYALCIKKRFFDKGEWDEKLPAHLEAAVSAAMEKATCYHCREPHYIDLSE